MVDLPNLYQCQGWPVSDEMVKTMVYLPPHQKYSPTSKASETTRNCQKSSETIRNTFTV